ncbi:DNA binding HTH domain, Psq-type [Phytophthora cactorum]|nr:DNA binding HTH domain, Psq-type [Phytophthora cactorum]
MEAASTTEEPPDEVTASTPVSGTIAATVGALISARTTQTKQYLKHYSIKEKRAVLQVIEGMSEREACRTQGVPRWTLNDRRKSAESIFGYTGCE